MRTAQVPALTENWLNSAGWRDIDFYKIKLVCDRVDGVGFWYYLRNPRQAWRDYWLWRKFDKLVKEKPKAKPRGRTFFKNKKSWAPPAELKKIDPDELKKQIEELRKKAVEYRSIEIPDKEKLRKLYDLALEMQTNDMLPKTKEALDEQVDRMLKFDDKAFEAFKKTIEDAIKAKK